jgi:energy-coupling factor transport system ATP-binding protein
VKAARSALRRLDISLPAQASAGVSPHTPKREPALRFHRVWHELRDGPVILRSITVSISAGERVALMGRNGAGKSTLLRHAAGLLEPTRGRIERSGPVALLLQNPGDYLVHETVGREASPSALELVGLRGLEQRHPRDLAGGERQRLALAIVLDFPDGPPALVCLDEPTRGMDRHLKADLADTLKALGTAVMVATHDPEFAAAFAQRVILLADGAPVADGTAHEVLTGGTYFATETARIAGILTPEEALTPVEEAVGTEETR